MWNGSSWDDGTGGAPGDAHFLGGVNDATLPTDFHSFDAAYEQVSGEALVVSGINTDGSVLWWVYNEATGWTNWTMEQLLGNAEAGGNWFDWVHLSPMPGTNRIAFIGIGNELRPTGQRARPAAIWDGDNNTFESSKQILSFPHGANLQNPHTTDAADIEFTLGGAEPRRGGRGVGQPAVRLRQRLEPRAAGSGNEAGARPGRRNKTVRWLRLEANPKSDDMVLAISHQDGSERTASLDRPLRRDDPHLGRPSSTHGPLRRATANRPFDLTWDPVLRDTAWSSSTRWATPSAAYSLHYANSDQRRCRLRPAQRPRDLPGPLGAGRARPRPDNKVRIAIQTDDLRVVVGERHDVAGGHVERDLDHDGVRGEPQRSAVRARRVAAVGRAA